MRSWIEILTEAEQLDRNHNQKNVRDTYVSLDSKHVSKYQHQKIVTNQ